MSAEYRYEKPDIDLGSGVSLTWSEHNGAKVGAIISHKKDDAPHGVCEGSIWIKGSPKIFGDHPVWEMTGTEEAPTFTPSVLCHCGFHGWIREGKWVSA